MFKIESYITPIILEHVAKYVKNIRPQDAQVSLWEGEVGFQNLDLRLDVLEEELKMPFEFLSGHIHELSIRVPWTRIMWEPIRITINTIEFVLKLKKEHKDASSAGSSPHHKNGDGTKRKVVPAEQPPAQQSAGSGLAYKIINNIIVECKNIILKYVEDDIVVSMNVQLLSFSSADENWRQVMVDVNPVSVLIRKLVNVSDLTICVDKRNAAGHIDVCQEPILYRCSFELRFLHKYNVNTRDTSSITRVAIFTKSMDINISSLQFPMTMRLLQMVISLMNANIVKHAKTEPPDEVAEEQAESENKDDSLLTWAWNMLPNFNNDANECEVTQYVETPGHMKEMALYLEKLNFTLKNSELMVDSIMGNTKRIRYTPIVRMSLGGLYVEKVNLDEVGWHNAKLGMSFIIVEPLGPYGGTEEFPSNAVIKSVNQELRAFTDKSLFDEKCCGSERGWCITNYDDYMGRFTDDYLSYRSPILAFDSVEYKQPTPKDPLRESIDTSKETYKNFRLLSAGVAFRWNSSFLQVKHFIQDLIDSYDYPAYYADKLDPNASGGSGGGGSPKLHPPLMEDYDALMQYIPLCIYRFDLKNISLEIHPRVEPEAPHKSQRRPSSALKLTTPYYIMHFTQLEGTLCTPIDGDKLVHTTCQLPNKPRVLIEACYKNYVINVKKLSLSMVNKTTKRTAKLLNIPQLNLIYGDLLQKQLWNEENIIPQRKCDLNCAVLKIEFNKRDLIDSMRLLECILSYRPYLLWKLAKLPIPSHINEAETLLNVFHGLKLSFQRYPSYSTCSARLQSLQSDLVIRGSKSVQKFPLLRTELNKNADSWLHGQMQHTVVDVTDENAFFVMAFWLEPFRIFVDRNLVEFLKYQEEYDFNIERDEGSEFELNAQYLQSHQPQVTAAAIPTGTASTGTAAPPPLMRRSSRNSLPSRKISQPEETIHFSSERDEKLGLDTVNVANDECKEADTRLMWDYLSSLILSIEIAEGHIDIAEKLKLNKECQILSPYTEIQLPRITFKSTNADGVSRTNLLEKFTPRSNYRENVNWVLALYALSIKKHFGDVTEVILAEIYTTITIAITHKTENQGNKSPDRGLSPPEHVELGIEVDSAAQDEVPPVSEAAIATGTVELHPKEIDTINIHVDTTPISFHISEPKCKMLLAHFYLLSSVIKLMMPMTRPTQHSKPPIQPIKIVPATEENSKIKQFLDLETNSEHSVAQEQKMESPPSVSMLCQWTIARIVVELESARQIRNSKIVLELEDLLATVDKRQDFSKYTSKVGQFNLNYYEPRSKAGWVEQTYLRVKMLGESVDMPFLNVIYTCVGLKNYYSRIGVKRKCDANRCISEILITMQAIEMVIDLDRLPEFIGSLCVFMNASNCKHCPSNETVANPITAADLPLIHLDSKGMTIYMPLDTGKPSCTALIWKIESMKVTPNVENPLQRTPVRADVYSKAAQLGFLTTPGALVEDRQYEFVLRNISAASGSWDEILNLLHEKAKTFYDTNPALEWNSQNRGSQPSLQIMDIFNDFTFICTFAPCITYNNILICGQAIEFNCASDFVANINTFQLNLVSCMVTAIADIGTLIQVTCQQSKRNKTIPTVASYSSGSSSTTYVSVKSSTSMNRYIPVDPHSSLQFKDVLASSTVFDSIDEDTEHNVKTDSGFQSNRSRRHRLERPSITSQLDRNDTNYSIPQTVSLVAGFFVINIFHIRETSQLGVEDLVPLFAFTISQPSFMLTQSLHDVVTLTSVFNMTISTQNAATLTKGTFSTIVFDTQPGALNATGIPPPLCTLRTHKNKQNIVEAEVEVSKPLVVTLDEEQMLLVLRNAVTVYEALLESNCFSIRTAKAVLRASKIQIMRHEFFSADRIRVKLAKVVAVFKHESDYNCKAVVCDSQMNVKFLPRPEKASMSAAIGSFHVQTGQKIFLHPTTVRIGATFVSEPWYSLPLAIITAKFSVVHLDIGVYGLRELRHALTASERVSEFFSTEWKKFLLGRPSMGTSSVDRERLVPLSKLTLSRLLEDNRKKKKYQREEYYQDDLRAGAFQFVEMATDSFLPLPYQIQIIRKNFGIICWRYPQPRKMVKIHIFPVPMAKPIHIKCRMEYFSEAHECFLHFCDFWLSETVSKQISLPERDICSHIWRVVILQSVISVNGECFDASEEEDDKEKIPSFKIEEIFKHDRKDSEFILHPRVLVGCMRIDTSFHAASVPKLQVLVTCTALQVKFLNQPNENSGLPPVLKFYRLSNTTQISQTFLVLLLERISVHASFISKRIYTVDSGFTLSVKCLDFGFLNMLPLLEETTIQSCVQVNDVKGTINVNAVVDKIRLNLGPTIIHTLLSSKEHWEELLDLIETRNRDALIPKCVVVNRTYSHVSFGQTGTTERVHLQAMECQLYYFSSDSHNQELTFFITDNETSITDVSQSVPIFFRFEGDTMAQPIRMGDRCLFITSRKLSATQIIVLIKGQIEVVSMVPHDLRIDFQCVCGCEERQEDRPPLEYMIETKNRASFYYNVQRSCNITMRLKFANAKGKGRTGDIPLKQNKKLPWLVKVPTMNSDFVSLWVRIVREDVASLQDESFAPQRILVTIWPIFEVRSMLPCPVSAEESVTKANFDLAPAGGSHELSVPATHLTEHTIALKYSFPLGSESKSEHTISLKKMEWNTFFWYDEQAWGIEDTLYKLSKDVPSKWPLDDEDELRVHRISKNTTKADVRYSCSAARDFSCTTCLEVSPWGLFINSTGFDVSICDCETQSRISVNSNGLEMLPSFSSAFTVDLPCDANWISSLPIHYKSKTPPNDGTRYCVLPQNGSIDIVLLRNSEVFKFVLELKIDNKRHVFKLRPKYAVMNFTKIKLHVLSFAMDHKESATREALETLETVVDKLELDPVESVNDCIGYTLDNFNDLKVAPKSNRSRDTAFVYFVCVKVAEDSDISIPIPLSMTFTRRCFSVQNGSESVPLVVTLIEKDRIFYLNIFKDITPAILVNNQTDVKFVIAQTSASENSRVTNTTPEYEGRHFEWFQQVPASSECYYTPPELYASFPDVESTMCNLTLALCDDKPTKKNLKWSKPIRTDKTWEKFLHIPNHGDVKVIICDKHRVIQVFIYYIAQMEFSVKDLRSRLLTPEPLSGQAEDIAQSNSLPSITKSVAIADTNTLLATPSKCMHFSNVCEMKTLLKVRFFVKEILLSLHTDVKERDFMKQEIFGLYVDDFVMAYDDDEDRRELSVVLPNLQIDNPIYWSGKYDFPVVLCAQQLYERSAMVPSVHYLDRTYRCLSNRSPMGHFTFKFFQDELKLSSIVCGLSPVRAYIEDAYLNDLLDAIVECTPSNCSYKPERPIERIVLAKGQLLLPRDVAAQAICIAEPLQLRSFEIQPLNVLLSVHTSLRLYIALDHSPLSFSTYNRQQILTLPLRFGQSLGMHYLSGAIFGAGWVVGSLEILGSPSGLARSFSTGLRDFVSMPMEGLFRGPWGFVVGVTQGSASLLRNITAGTVNSVTKLASSVARNLDRLTLDQEHIERTEALRRCRPQGFTDGFSQGITGFGISILGAVGGLARHTLEARSPVEVVTGMGKGLVGALTKPISGAAELLALAGQGMLHTVGFNAMPDQRAPTVRQNMAIEPSAYRIWKLLPNVLKSDQILFNHEVTLVVQDQLRRGYAFLTSAVFAIMEAQSDNLACVIPIGKLEMTSDAVDKTLYYIHLVKDKEDADEDINYTNQRIMTFLHSSYSLKFMATTESFADLLHTHEEEFQANRRRKLDWAFYISEALGEHIISYLKIMNSNH